MKHSLIWDKYELLVKLHNDWAFLDRSGWKKLLVSDISAQNLELPYANTIVLIPCYNVANLCDAVIRKALEEADQVIVIDDGSTDNTRQVVENIISTSNGNLHIIKKDMNEGKGSALLDGMKFASNHYRFSVLITMDGDGQHRAEDIPKAKETLGLDKNFVIGGRAFSKMPLRSRFGNTITRGLFHLLFPKCPNDTQSGYRAFSPTFVKTITSIIDKGRYETELYILLLALELTVGINYFEIDTIYIDENRSSHFRPVMDSFRIMSSLLRWQISALF